MRIAPILGLLLASLASACSPSEGETTPAPTNAPKPIRLMGEYPALKTADTSQISNIPNAAFFKNQVPCSNKKELALGIFEIAKIGLSADSEPTLAAWGVDDVQLKDEKGKIVVVAYTIRPGDAGAMSTIAEYYLVNQNCNIFMLGAKDI